MINKVKVFLSLRLPSLLSQRSSLPPRLYSWMLLRKFDCSTGSGPFSRDKGSDSSLSFNAPKQQEGETVLLLSCLIRFGTQSRGRVNEFGVISFTSLGWFIVTSHSFWVFFCRTLSVYVGFIFTHYYHMSHSSIQLVMWLFPVDFLRCLGFVVNVTWLLTGHFIQPCH